MSKHNLEWVAHWLMPEEDRAVAESWKRKSKCLDLGPELSDRYFFPPSAPFGASPAVIKEFETEKKRITKEGKKFCLGQSHGPACPVRLECLAYALENQLWEGVWGGTSGRERRKFGRQLLTEVPVSISGSRTRRSKPTPSSSDESRSSSSSSASSATKGATPSTSTPATSARPAGARGQRGTRSQG